MALFPFGCVVMLVWLLLSGLLVSPCGHAQENVGADSSAPAAIALPEMTVTASREERTSFDVPQAVTVIGREALERRTPGVLPDLLRGEAGIFVQQTTPGQAAPIIRGLLGSATLMLVDGMRLNTAFFRPAPNQYFAMWMEGFFRFAADQNRLSERDKGDPRINPKGTPGWVTANLRAGWQINEYVSVKGALENMFDKSYREHGSGINAPGVNAILTLETRF